MPKILYTLTTPSGNQGELARITWPEGGSVDYGYDGSGNRTSVTDALARTTSSTYNAMGRVTSISDPNPSLKILFYAANNVDLEQIVTGLGAITLTYNAQHDVTSITDRLNNTVDLA